MGKGSYMDDPAVMHAHGFKLSTKRENVCKTCKQLFRSGCCPDYTRAGGKANKLVIHGDGGAGHARVSNPVTALQISPASLQSQQVAARWATGAAPRTELPRSGPRASTVS